MRETIIETKLICPRCKTITTIFRKASRPKKIGHYKKLYCYNCRSTHNHIELGTDRNYTNAEIEALIEQMKKDKKYELDEIGGKNV